MVSKHHGVTALAFSPDGIRLLAGGSEGTVKITTSRLFLYRYHGHEGEIRSLSFSPDGKTVASASADSTVQVWDVISGKRNLLYTGHKDQVESVAWSPDGRYLASCDQREVQVWEAGTGTLCFY